MGVAGQAINRPERRLSVHEARAESYAAGPLKLLVDAGAITRSIKTDSRPLKRKRFVSLVDVPESVLMGVSDEDSLTSLAGRLARLEKEI